MKRTTVTLEDDLRVALKRTADERGITFQAALNAALRRGLNPEPGDAGPYRVPDLPLRARPDVDLTKATALATEIEDAQIVGKAARGA